MTSDELVELEKLIDEIDYYILKDENSNMYGLWVQIEKYLEILLATYKNQQGVE